MQKINTEPIFKSVEPDRIQQELLLDTEIWAVLAKKTEELFLDNKEFYCFILKKIGNPDILIEVGRGYVNGISFGFAEVIQALQAHILNGYSVVASYHNHTLEGVKVYKQQGFEVGAAAVPSGSDLEHPMVEKLRNIFGMNFVFMIGIYDTSSKLVLCNAYKLTRSVVVGESMNWEFPDPFYVEDIPDASGVSLGPGRFSDPNLIAHSGIVEIVKLKVGKNVDSSVEMKNCVWD